MFTKNPVQAQRAVSNQANEPGATTQYNNAFNVATEGSGSGHSHNMSATFSGSAVNAAIVQPYIALIYIIKT